MRPAIVHVDLTNRSCYVASPDTFHGAWAPGVTRSTAEIAIAAGGWRFVPDSEWTLTPDGGTREVELDPVAQDDARLDLLGCATPDALDDLADDELSALLFTWREATEARPIPGLVDTQAAVRVIAAAAPRSDLDGAVQEHTAHSAIVAARRHSASVVADYDPARQVAAERSLAYRDNTASELRAATRKVTA